MPEIAKEFQIQNIGAREVYALLKESMESIGLRDMEESILSEAPFSAELTGFAPSAFGWGRLDLRTSVTEEGKSCKFQVTGYIAQLSTGPVTKLMDKLIGKFSELISQKHGYHFEHKAVSSEFMPKMKWKKEDTITIIGGVVGVTVLMAIELSIGGIFTYIIGAMVVGIIYILRRSVRNKGD